MDSNWNLKIFYNVVKELHNPLELELQGTIHIRQAE